MLKIRPAICLLTFLLLLPGCDHSREENVRHQEISEEETDRAIKEVFAESSGTDAGNHPEGLSRFFENLSSASRSDSPLDPDRFLSIDAMAASLKSTDSMKKAPRDFVKNLKAALDQQKEKIGGNLQLLGFDDFKVLFVEESPQGGKLVYTRLYDNELNIVHQMRWWFVETETGWRIYDFEDLSTGIRAISLMARLMATMATGHTPEWITDYVALSRQLATVTDDPETILALEPGLLKLRNHQLPDDIRGFSSTLMISVLTAREDFEKALAELEAAAAGSYQSPLHPYQKGSVMMGLERYEDALASFDTFMSKFGRDSDTLELVSDCHLLLDQVEKARETSLEGLADNPSSTGCLASLTAATSLEAVIEEDFLLRFESMPDPESAYELVLDYLIELDKTEHVEALFKVFKTKQPDSALVEYYEDFLSGE